MAGRERMFEQGAGALSEVELISVLLGSGTRAHPAAVVAAQLLERCGGLARLRRASLGVLLDLPGIGEAQACRVVAALELGRRAASLRPPRAPRLLNATDLARRLWPRLVALPHEEFWAILLTARNEEIRSVRISSGGLSQCSVLAREAFSPAIAHRAPQIAFLHNHPSGDPLPSPDDQRLELVLDEAGHTLGVRVIDHLVIGERGLFSARQGSCPPPPALPELEQDHDPIAPCKHVG